MRIGIIGAGQLGRMLALAGYPLGLRFVFLDQSADAPGAQVGRIITGAFDDRQQARRAGARSRRHHLRRRERAGRGRADDRRDASRFCRRSLRSARRRIDCTRRRCSGS